MLITTHKGLIHLKSGSLYQWQHCKEGEIDIFVVSKITIGADLPLNATGMCYAWYTSSASYTSIIMSDPSLFWQTDSLVFKSRDLLEWKRKLEMDKEEIFCDKMREYVEAEYKKQIDE